MPVRLPHVAGTFYPSDPEELKKYCESRLQPYPRAALARAVLLPHAGYFYSGDTASQVLRRVTVPSRVFLIGPNHYASGAEFALCSQDEWATPLGNVAIDREFAVNLLGFSEEIREDDSAHRHEHSLEVEIPFLQIMNPQLKIIPLVVSTVDLTAARRIAEACGRFLSSLGEKPLLVISSDMNHYDTDTETRIKDRYALDAILSLDAEALVKAVRSHRITMCGFLPVYMLLIMKDVLGISKATLVDYRTSADATGEKERVVGYAGIIFE